MTVFIIFIVAVIILVGARMARNNHCPRCGEEVQRVTFEDGHERWVCEGCGRIID